MGMLKHQDRMAGVAGAWHLHDEVRSRQGPGHTGPKGLEGRREESEFYCDILYLFCNLFFLCVCFFSLNVASWVTFHMLSLSTKA